MHFSYSNQLARDNIVEKAYYYYKNPDEWGEYDILSNNCEHFATYCATGHKMSGQVVTTAVRGIAFGLGMLAVAAGALLLGEDERDSKRKKERITL